MHQCLAIVVVLVIAAIAAAPDPRPALRRPALCWLALIAHLARGAVPLIIARRILPPELPSDLRRVAVTGVALLLIVGLEGRAALRPSEPKIVAANAGVVLGLDLEIACLSLSTWLLAMRWSSSATRALSTAAWLLPVFTAISAGPGPELVFSALGPLAALRHRRTAA